MPYNIFLNRQSAALKSSNQNRLYTPCIRKCCLNEDDICLGCFRSIDEIMRWTQVDITARQHILNNADNRQQMLAQGTGKTND